MLWVERMKQTAGTGAFIGGVMTNNGLMKDSVLMGHLAQVGCLGPDRHVRLGKTRQQELSIKGNVVSIDRRHLPDLDDSSSLKKRGKFKQHFTFLYLHYF